MSKLYNAKESRLIGLLKSLSLKEKRDLEKFLMLSSNHLTTKDRVIYSQLIKSYDKANFFDENKFWSTILSKNEITNKNRIKSRLLKAIENYICLLEINNHEGLKTHLQSSFYSKRGLNYNLLQSLNKGIRKLHSIKNGDLNIKMILYWLYEKMIFASKDIRVESEHLQNMENQLTEFYVVNKMRIICEKLNRLVILNSGKDALYYRDEIEYLEKSTNSIYSKIYYHLYLLISEDQPASFIFINNEIEKLDQSLNPELLKELYIHLMNHCIRRINERKLEFAESFLNYVKFLDLNNMLLDHNILSIGRFKNILVICYILDKIEWATYFMDKYSDHLQETKVINQKDFLSLNHAILALWRNNYDECIKHIHKFQSSNVYHKDIYYKISCDKLILKVFFEKGEVELLDNKISVLIAYIRNRKKLSKKRKTPNLTFLSILDKLNSKRIVDIEGVKENIPIADYIWLKKVYYRNNKLTSI